ncbi:hypothetical protein SAMN05443633_104389 [Chryseobacterium arachidis]|uniref:Uncharacterized protein n=2 Tax=Chryseobacterium arachidis TaxID=1416778 RepID=A0A1M5C3L9_9FLAO|nr:hypothetical protein SAMN05443633_104389 [Chryseobacterium arachidis]
MLFTAVVTSCTRTLDIQEDVNDNISRQTTYKIHAKESDSAFSSGDELYPDPDVPIKDTHDWKTKP